MLIGNQAVPLRFFFVRQEEKVVLSPPNKRKMPDCSLISSMTLVPILIPVRRESGLRFLFKETMLTAV